MKKNTLIIALVLTGTLAIGFALGMLTSAQIRNAHIKKMRSFSSTDRFVYWTLHILQATPEQEKKIVPVIRKYGEKNNKLRENYRNDFIALMKAFKKELDPYLTQEQRERLERMPYAGSHKKRPSHRGGPPSGRGPGHGPDQIPCPGL